MNDIAFSLTHSHTHTNTHTHTHKTGDYAVYAVFLPINRKLRMRPAQALSALPPHVLQSPTVARIMLMY